MADSAGDRLTKLETLLSTVIDQNKEAFKRLDDTHGDHETRIRALERQVWMAFGGASILSIVFSVVVQYLMSR